MRFVIWLIVAFLLYLFSGCGLSPITVVTVDAGTDSGQFDLESDVGRIDATPECGAGYRRVVYYPRDAVFCELTGDPTDDRPCGDGNVVWWGGKGVIRCE